MGKKIIGIVLAALVLIATLCGCMDTVIDLADTVLASTEEESSLPEESQAEPDEEVEEANQSQAPPQEEVGDTATEIAEDGEYSSKEEVAEYINKYGHLPSNYITKKEAQELGWVSNKGNLWEVAEGKSIGGDRFGNREGLLPNADGRKWFECDINFDGSYRNGKRIVYSNDGLIYYTDDHYESFTQIY